MSSEVEVPAEAPVDPRHQALIDGYAAEFGDAVLATVSARHDLCVRMAPTAWREAAHFSQQKLGLRYFCFLAGLDWKQNPDLGGAKVWDPDAEPSPDPGDGPGNWKTGVSGGDTRFQVFARLYDVALHLGVTLKVDAGDDDPSVLSWVPVFRGADWHERETWEMYGITFDGHPGLRHLYLPGAFEGFPLRKDFPLLAREVKPWPGLVNVEGLPGEPDSDDAETQAGGDA